MTESYRIINDKDSKSMAEYLAKNGQLLLPMVELIEASRMAIDELIDFLGPASIEAVLKLSAENIAGAKAAETQRGRDRLARKTVRLLDQKLRVSKPRLRRKGKGRGGEVEIPAYETIKGNGHIWSRMLDILMCNVSTRNYEHVISQMADTVGVKKSSVSRTFIEESGRELERLAERRFDDIELLILYLEGIVFGEHHALCAMGVDNNSRKHVLGLREGASESAAVVTSLLEELVDKDIDPKRRYLFVINGSKALRSAIDKVFGSQSPVQRCRQHKVKNVCDKLPEELSEQVKSVMKAAYRIPWKEGMHGSANKPSGCRLSTPMLRPV